MKECIIPEFEDNFEFAYNRHTLDMINNGVAALFINDYVTIKYTKLSLPIYNKTQYLPDEIIRDFLKEEIFKANRTIEENPKWSMFTRPTLLIHQDNQQLFSTNQYTDLEIQINGFLSSDVYEYLNYSSEKHIISISDLSGYSNIGDCFPIDLPKINELIDYLAYLQYYKWLINSYKSNLIELPKPQSNPIPLELNLSNERQNKLFELLINNNYIAANTHKESFKWAFSTQKRALMNWEPIRWIDFAPTKKQSNLQTLYELLYLLGVDKDTSPKNPHNIYRKIEYCFRDSENKDLKDIESKNPYRLSTTLTKRKTILRQIIKEVLA